MSDMNEEIYQTPSPSLPSISSLSGISDQMWAPTMVDTAPPAPPPPIPPLLTSVPDTKQFYRVDRQTANVLGSLFQPFPPEDTDEYFYINLGAPLSDQENSSRSPTEKLRYRGGSSLVWEETASVEEIRARAIGSIDAAGEELRMAVITRLTQTPEYERAERHAREYQAAGYPEGEYAYVPPGVASWAQAKWREGWTARQAADDILATADRWYQILDDIRALRLTNKEDVRAAGTAAEITAICSDMNADMGAITQRLRLTITS